MLKYLTKVKLKGKINPKKVYIIDTGYSTALGYEFSLSKAMENAVYLELVRRNYGNISIGKNTESQKDFQFPLWDSI